MSKAKVAVVVDSTAYIPPALVAQYNIHVIPQILNWEGSSLRDDVDIKPDAFYARLATAKEMPTTSQPSAGEFHEFFSKVAETADSIVAVLISNSLSGTQASAQAASSMMEDYPIEIVDSQSAAMGLGYMAVTAARAIENGADYQAAAEAAGNVVEDHGSHGSRLGNTRHLLLEGNPAAFDKRHGAGQPGIRYLLFERSLHKDQRA